MTTRTPSPAAASEPSADRGTAPLPAGFAGSTSPPAPPLGGEGCSRCGASCVAANAEEARIGSVGGSPPFPPREGGPGGLGGSGLRRRYLILALPLVALLAVALWYAFFRGPSDDLGRMQGDWAIRGADGRDRGIVRIAGDRWTYHSAGKEQATHRIALNPAAAPKEIDLTALEPDGRAKTFTRGATGVEMKELGVYNLSGDELRIAKAPAWHGGRRPATLDDPDAPALTLTRVSR